MAPHAMTIKKMGIENNFGFKPAKIENKKIDKFEKQNQISRRRFLKDMVELVGKAATGYAAIKAIEQVVNYKEKSGNKEQVANKKTVKEGLKDEPTEEQQEIENEDSVSSKEVLNFNNEGPIEFNLKTTEAIKNNWKEKYRNNPKLRNSFIKAYHDIGYWRPYLERIFEDRGVPKEFIFLAIPESHWQPGAVSRTGAAGAYQFMPKTAEMYDLTVNANYDERKDPLLSAGACADLLADLYKATKDWNLALSGYNGSFIWKYLKKAKAGESEVSYEGFLKFIEDKLNLIKDEVKDMDSYNITVRRGENLDVIAARYGLSRAELANYNKIANSRNLKAGQKIAIPMRQSDKQAVFNKKISGFSENLNYPAKYYAIMELIEEGFVKEQAEPIIFEIRKINPLTPRHNFYTAKAEDKNLYRISKKFNINFKQLVAFNPEAVRNLRAGLEIKIPNAKSRQVTLADVARQTNKPLRRLEFLNPAIKKNAAITTNQIRV